MNKLTEIASKTLGDSTSYAVFTDKFDPSLLNPMPRNLAREGWGIKGDEFEGVDVWHCHESTFLLDSGKPVSGTLKFVYDAASEFMVESKSMKLYLNTFDMCRMGATRKEAVDNYVNQVCSDLTAILGVEVRGSFHTPETYRIRPNDGLAGWGTGAYLDAAVSDNIAFSDFDGKGSHVAVAEHLARDPVQNWYTNSLRSRCRHTKQKDTGAAYFIIDHPNEVLPASLLRQVVSLREVNEFHEFCAEKLFVEIKDSINPTNHTVALLYARRGSLDINPIRWSNNPAVSVYMHQHSGILDLVDPYVLTPKAFGQ